MGDVDYYLIRVHPFGGYSAVPVNATDTRTPEVTASDWRFPNLELAVQWADSQNAPAGLTFHDECEPIGDFAIDGSDAYTSTVDSTRLRPTSDPVTLARVFALAEGYRNAWGEGGPSFSELGQALFSNSYTYPHNAEWATEGMGLIAENIAHSREDEFFLDANSGGEPYENDTFIMRPYCRCDGETPGHSTHCPPNFVHKPTGLEISWYKHAGRGITADRTRPDDWNEIVLACMQSVKKAEVTTQ